MKSNNPVLLVEDDDVDTMTVKRAFTELNITNPLICTVNGEEALEYLRDPNNTRPCVILLDLNMPKMNGIEFMKIVKEDDDLKSLTIVVLTTSQDEHDKIESFNFSVAGYMIKPVDYKQFVEVIRTINIYWSLSEVKV